jgi:hypothetical protein
MAKKTRPFTDAERDKLSVLSDWLLLLNKSIRVYNFTVAGDKQDPRWVSHADTNSIIKDNRAVALLHSVPNSAVEDLKKIFDAAHLPYGCDEDVVEKHRKRSLFYIDIDRTTRASIGAAVDEIATRVQEISGKNFGEMMRQMNQRANIGIRPVRGNEKTSDSPPLPTILSLIQSKKKKPDNDRTPG